MVDTFAMNNWVYHPFFVPTYYIIETKWYGFEILKNRIYEKWLKYRGVQFLFQKDKVIKMKDGTRQPIREVVPEEAIYYDFEVVSRDPKRSSSTKDAKYDYQEKTLTKSYDASLTHLLEMIHRLGYKMIILCGMDMKDSHYFWTNPEWYYGEVHHRTNKEHEKKDPKKPHNTIIVKDFVVSYAQRLAEEDVSVLLGHSYSALNQQIPVIDWRTL